MKTSDRVFLLFNLFTNSMKDKELRKLLLICTVCRMLSSWNAVVNRPHNTLTHGMKQFAKIKKEGVAGLINLLLLKNLSILIPHF